MQQSKNSRRRLSIALVVVALLGASCDGDDADEAVGTDIGADRPTTTVPETTTTAPPATTTTTAAPTPEEEILAAHAGYWAAVDEAFSLPQVQPDLPALSRYATGEALERVRQSADETLQANEAYRVPEGGLYEHRAQVVSAEGTTATVRDCNIDDTVVVDTDSGDVVDDAVSTRLYISMLMQEGGQWKVALVNRESTWDGVAGCALEQQ